MITGSGDTIAAIATAPGRGGVGIVRLSGPGVAPLATKVTGRTLKPRYAHYVDFVHPDTGCLIDQGLALFFPHPHSLTGEDVLELQGHGGPVILDLLLQVLLSQPGVRQARPGEFSERAFLNDKMDLAQAEAIADLIDASSQQAARNAMQSLQGVFSAKIHALAERLDQLRIYVEAAINFPEEEIDFLNDQQLFEGITALASALTEVLAQARQGVILREGMTLVISGKPNAGKSSLLNALAGRETAIVTDIPGTTRDVLREYIHLDAMPLHIIDTAGLRSGGDTVEQLGIARAWGEIDRADHILLLVDGTETHAQQALDDLLAQFKRHPSRSHGDCSRITVVVTKNDLTHRTPVLNTPGPLPQLSISAKTGEGIEELTRHLQGVMGYQQTGEGGFSARRRHLRALEQTQQLVGLALARLHQGAGELVAEELRQAQLVLGEITGQVSSDDLLGRIFSSFCIGK